IPGLTNGTAYTVYLRAVNAAGSGAGSAGVSGTPRTTPSAPTSLVATPGNGELSIAFTAGADGGSAITNYEYSLNNSTWTALSPVDTTTPVTIPGLTNGTAYTVYLRAVNAAGSGAGSAGVSGTPRTTPGAPTIGTITPGNGQLSVAFTAPASDGGSAITDYKWSIDGTTYTTRAGTANPIVITGLTNGTAYTVRIRAVNAAGDGAVATASSTATPMAAPTVTTTSPATGIGSTAATLAGNVTATNGATVTERGVFYSTTNGFADGAGTKASSTGTFGTGAFSNTVTGLSKQTTYYFKAFAANAAGTNYGSQVSFSTLRAPDGLNPISNTNPTNAFLGDLDIQLYARAWRDFNVDGGSTWTPRGFATIFGRFNNSDLTTNTVQGTGRDPGSADEDFFARTPLFTQTGTFYWAMRVSYGAGNDYFYDRSMTNWLPLATTLPQTATLAIEVLPLNTPTNQVASAASSTSVNLGWTPGNSGGARWTMIVRSTDTSFTAPTNGTAYAVGNTNLGGDRVIFFGSGTNTNTTDTGLNANTTYYYRFYSENNAYYSAGVDANAATTGSPVISIQGSTNNATAAAFTTTYGTASAAQTFTIAGSNLTENITTGTAPSGFELSTNGSSWTTNAQTFTRSGSTASGTLHLRLATNAPVAGTYNSRTISVASGGVTNNIVTAASSNAVSRAVLTATAGNQSVVFGSSIASVTNAGTVTYSGFVNGETNTVITGSPTFTTTYIATTPASTAGVTITPVVTGLTAANYSFTAANGTITVTPLNNPSNVTVSRSSSLPLTRLNLGWSLADNRDVLIVRNTSDTWTAPAVGVQYTNGQSLGTGTVVYKDGGTNLTQDGLLPGTTYFYRLYSENFGTYSAGTNGSATTDPVVARNAGGAATPSVTLTDGSNATLYVGDTASFSFDSTPTIASSTDTNWGQPRLRFKFNNDDLSTGALVATNDFVNTTNKQVISTNRFTNSGTWYWAMQMSYGSAYGSAFWYKSSSTNFTNMAADGTGSTLSFAVTALPDPSGVTVASPGTTTNTVSFTRTGRSGGEFAAFIVRKASSAVDWTPT
ncbi:MAG: beta strand repeat-containing protein, partial [Chthoniobacterales bacterium]